MKILLIVAAIIVVAVVATQFFLSGIFSARVDDLKRRLPAPQMSAAPDQLLIPVWVREFVARNGGRMGGPTAVDMVQSTEMRLQPDQTFFHIDATSRELCKRVGKTEADVAVRSSATAEDLPEASFAGQQDTFLNIRGERTRLRLACRRYNGRNSPAADSRRLGGEDRLAGSADRRVYRRCERPRAGNRQG